jgi:hypothetical protein
MVHRRESTNWDDPAFAGRCNICGKDIDPALDPYPMLMHVNDHKETHRVCVSVVIQGQKWSPEYAAAMKQGTENTVPLRRIKG